jgi:hypothetical protein
MVPVEELLYRLSSVRPGGSAQPVGMVPVRELSDRYSFVRLSAGPARRDGAVRIC